METTLPGQAPVVVIGGGVMGCSTLYHLAKLGICDAILIERNKLTSGTTWHSAAQVRALRSTRNLSELIRYSIVLFSALESETGQATGWINRGSLSIACNEHRHTHIKRQAALARAFDVRAEVISPG
jgi:4-methylaminobutanoate oxidase (formaldehyde-forming)